MIRACISGAASRVAGELIRILVNHPDVELAAAYAPGHTGERVTSIHHGLIGETDLQLSETPPQPSAIDALVICEPSDFAAEVALNPGKYPDLRVIDIGRRGLTQCAAVTTCRKTTQHEFDAVTRAAAPSAHTALARPVPRLPS